MTDFLVNMGLVLIASGLFVAYMQYYENKKRREAEEVFNKTIEILNAWDNKKKG
jgi:hypothetical protein